MLKIDSSLPPIKSEALSLSKRGKTFSKGRCVTRLQWGKDKRFYVAAKIVKSNNLLDQMGGKINKKLHRYVELKNDNGAITYVNIRSLSSRLLLDKDKIEEAAKQKNLPSLIEKRMQTVASIVDGMVSGHDQIIKKFGEEFQIDLSSKKLMHAIREVVISEQYQEFTIQNHRSYQIGFNESTKEVELIILENPFAKGTYGEVRVVENILNSTQEVFKQARHKKKAEEDIKNEYDQLTFIHSDGKRVWGLQSPPRRIVEIKDGKTKQYGYIGEKYDGHYGEYLKKIAGKRKFKDLIVEFHQILSGLKELADRNIVHGDLKRENIFIKSDNDNTKIVHLADLGGAYRVPTDPPADLKKLAGGYRPYTRATSAREDLILGYKLVKEGKFSELVELEKKRDVLSIGCTLQEVIGGLDFFEYDEKGFLDLESYKSTRSEQIPKKIQNLINRMLDSDYQKRPTAQEAFDEFDQYIKNHYSNIYKQIQEKIQKKYLGSTGN